MKSLKKIAGVFCFLAMGSLASETVNARAISTCNKPKLAIATDCVGLNTSASVEGNPFIYTNPEASCDLGLELPGLPSLGFDLGSLDFCAIAESLTSDLVNDINTGMQEAVNGALEEVGLSQDMEFSADLQEMAMDALEGAQDSNNGDADADTDESQINAFGQDTSLRGTPDCPSLYFDRRECGFVDGT